MRSLPGVRVVRRPGIFLPVLLVALISVACQGAGGATAGPADVPATAKAPTVPASQTPTVSPPAVTPRPVATALSTPTAAPTPTAVAATPTSTPTPPATVTPVPTSAPPPPSTPAQSPLSGEFFLNLTEPAELDIFPDSPSLEIVGQTRVDAIVTVNDDVVEPDENGIFSHTITLEAGVNIVEVVGSVSSGEQKSYVITAVYLP